MRGQKTRRTWFLLVFFVVWWSACQPRVSQESWAYSPNKANAGPDLSVSIQFLEERLAKRPRAYLEQAELAGLYLQRSRSQRSEDDYLKAQKWLGQSLAEYENSPALLVKADSLQMKHRFGEALDTLSRLAAKEPDNLAALVTKVRIKLAQGQAKQAREIFLTIPKSPLSSLRFLEGQVAEANGEVDEARALYARAIRSEGDGGSSSESARMRAVMARLELKQGRLPEALTLLEAARTIPVGQPLTEVLCAKVLSAQGKHSEAEEVLRVGYELYRDPLFLLRLGEIELAAGKAEAAQNTFATAAQLLKSEAFGHERDLALALFYLDPASNASEVEELMRVELERRSDPETLRIQSVISGKLNVNRP